jgi:hypothetical protein
MKKILLGLLLTMTLKSFSQAVLYSVSGSTYTQDFQSITSTNLTPATIANTTMFEVSGLSGGGTVSGWYAYHQASGTPRWGRSDGNSNSGSFFGMFDSQSTPNRAFGSQGSGGIIGLIGTVLRNTTGATINTVVITYKAVINRNPSTTVNNYPMSYRVSSTNVVTSLATGDGTFNDGAGTWTNGTGFSTPAAGTGSPNTTQAAISPLFMIGGAPITQTLTGLNWANNQYLYIRWRETDESGADATAGIDDFSITAPVATSTVLVTAQDPNTPTPVNWAIGSTLNQFYWAAITPASLAATLNSVTANMTGNYVAADIATNGLKLYYSSDATFIPAGDVLLSSQSSAKVGATETITWSGLSQSFSSGTTGYIYATADISGSANAGNTLAGSFGSNANVVFSPTVAYNSGNTYGSTTDKTFASLPTNPTIFNVNCSSQANIKVNMNAPTVGSVLVFANTGTTFTVPTGAGSGFTGANSNYGLATNYPAVGGRLVYSGAGANFTVTGLTLGQTYSLIAYSYSGSTWSSGTSVITGTAITQPVTATVVTPSSGQVNLSWTNPSSSACNNNVIVIARQGTAVESSISKANFDGLVSDVDFTGANATWTLNSNTNDVFDLTAGLIGTDNTNFLIYKGTGNSVTINGLTNGTTYFFRIFTVDGNGSSARWSNAVDASGTPDVPGYFWNGGNISAIPANGGSGTWGTSNAWRQPGASGSPTTWVDGNPAVFSGNAGVVTLDASRSATGYSFNTSSYTLQTTSSTGINLTGPISISTNQELVLAPNLPSTTFGVIGVSSINGSGTSSVVIYGNPASSIENSRINLASANSTINVPTEIKSNSGLGMAGYVSTSVGGVINGNIINNSNLRTMIGATSGNDLTINGVISGSSGLQFS